MAIQPMNDDVQIIQHLSDNPNQDDGLSAAQMKEKFDAASVLIKAYLNGTLVPAVQQLQKALNNGEIIGVDDTLSIAGQAADAKATGDALAKKAPAGYGLGAVVDIRAADLDSTAENGWYRIANQSLTVGGATYSDWYIHVKRYSSQYYAQEMIPIMAQQCRLIRWFVNGQLTEEWENPPMLPGIEYRTTERYGGNAVYRKLVEYTNAESLGSASGVSNTKVPHGISKFNELVRIAGKKNSDLLPYLNSAGGLTLASSASSANIFIDTYNCAWPSGQKWRFDIAYTKTSN